MNSPDDDVNYTEQQCQRSGLCSKYRGVRKRKWGKWVSEIRLPNSRERIWLGSYDSPEKAARAFDAALFCLRGTHAKFNFPENPPEIVGAQSLSPQEIQVVAATFANNKDNDDDDDVEKEKENVDHHQLPPNEYQPHDPRPLPSDLREVQADCSDRAIDWSFLSSLEYSNQNFYDFDHFSYSGGELSLPLSLLGPAAHDYDRGEENDADGASSNQSFLWNF